MEAGARKESPRAGSRASQLAINLLVLAATLLAMRGGFELLFPRILTALPLVRNLGDRLRHRRSHAVKHSPPEYGSYNTATLGGQEANLPHRLQGPALELSDSEVDLALEVFERSLRFLRSDLRAPRRTGARARPAGLLWGGETAQAFLIANAALFP